MNRKHSEPILILDVPSVAQWTFWRESHVSLTVNAFFASVCRFVKEYESTNVLWCFDDLVSLRKSALPCYKAKRKDTDMKRDPKLQERVMQCRRLISQLCNEILPDFGYCPIWQSGLEADDMIAAACRQFRSRRKMIISTDSDLWQLLDSQTIMFSPSQNKHYTASWFEREYGIKPKLWSLVKAIAGCASDNVPGVPGVGEKSAIKYILGTLTGKKLEAIESNMELIYFNRELVKLPHKATGCLPSGIFNTVTEKEWMEACERWDVDIWCNSLNGWIPNVGYPF
jgi:5'-3' exonuclease